MFSLGCTKKIEKHGDKFSFSAQDLKLGKTLMVIQNDLLLMYDNGEVNLPFTMTRIGDYRIYIKVKGAVMHNVWPKFSVLLNGKIIGAGEANSDIISEKIFFGHLSTNVNLLTIQYFNDEFDSKTKEDRNLYIQSFKFERVD